MGNSSLGKGGLIHNEIANHCHVDRGAGKKGQSHRHKQEVCHRDGRNMPGFKVSVWITHLSNEGFRFTTFAEEIV